MFSFLHRWFSDNTVDLDGLSEREVERAVETAVESTDKRLRLVGGYQRKLRPAVVEALLHARDLIHRIPGPVEVSRATFAHDPMVNTLFCSAGQIEEVFGLCAEAQDCRKNAWSTGEDHLHGLLLMSLNEKTRPGFVLNGDMVQGDVLQNVVYFSDHSLVKVATGEDQVRIGLRQRAFDSMLQEFNRRVSAHTLRSTELKREQARLRRELGQTGAGWQHNTDPLQTANPKAARELAGVDNELDALSQSLAHVDDYLDLLIEILTNPDDHCGLQHRELTLDRNGVKLGEAAVEGHQVPYAEITVGDLQRAGMLVKYPLEELPEQADLGRLYRVNY